MDALIPSQRTAARDIDAPDPIDDYHRLVSAVFADHRPVPRADGPTREEQCSCGQPWPCVQERRAAQLLDWV